MKQEIFSHFANEIPLETTEQYSVYRLRVKDGNGTAAVYPVFHGMEVVFLSIEADQYIPTAACRADVLEINYCLSGRCECAMEDGCVQYIGEGDLLVNAESNHSHRTILPLGRYSGLVILIDLPAINTILPNIIPELDIDLTALMNRIFTRCGCYIVPARDEVQQLFACLPAAPTEAKSVLCRLKAQELLLFLHYFRPEQEKQKKVYERQQVELIKQIRKQLTAHPGIRYTIEDLSRQYGMSPTVLKANFKGVYGASIASYMKDYRMQYAASLLRDTPISIAEIATQVGYGSQSKFGTAFKEQMNMSPMEFRKKHQKAD